MKKVEEVEAEEAVNDSFPVEISESIELKNEQDSSENEQVIESLVEDNTLDKAREIDSLAAKYLAKRDKNGLYSVPMGEKNKLF